MIHWEEARDIVDSVLDLAPEARTSYLDKFCPEPYLHRYVESLIHSYEQAGGFLAESGLAHHPLALAPAGVWQGRRLGAYQILEAIGDGDMGEVYRARRPDDQYQKEVAVKRAQKRGGDQVTLVLDEAVALLRHREVDLVRLDDAVQSRPSST